MGTIAQRHRTLDEFVRARSSPIQTDCQGPDFSLTFVTSESGTDQSFSITFREGVVTAVRPAVDRADYVAHCGSAELLRISNGTSELWGPFWDRYLPRARVDWAPALYAFFFPHHSYLRLTPVLRAIYRSPQFYPSITPFTQGYALYTFCVEQKIERTLEIGLGYGASALFFLSAHAELQRGRHTAVDPFQQLEFNGVGLKFIADSGLQDRFSFCPVTSKDGLAKLARRQEFFDLVYIDADHSVYGVLADFLGANAVLCEGGFLAFDDSYFRSGKKVFEVAAKHFQFLFFQRRALTD